jgi:hypothetical protein
MHSSRNTLFKYSNHAEEPHTPAPLAAPFSLPPDDEIEDGVSERELKEIGRELAKDNRYSERHVLTVLLVYGAEV